MTKAFSLNRVALFNGWPLFVLIVSAISLVLVSAMLRLDMLEAANVSSLIARSVQLSVPWLYLAFCASSVHYLWRGEGGRWLLRNRRYLGLAYAAGMGWQAIFILWLVTLHFGYYLEVANLPYDLAEEAPGYVLLGAMVWTSFAPGRRRLSANQWKWLHKIGIYYLWGETWATYWFYSYYYEDPQLI
jgi:hypothetical protein